MQGLVCKRLGPDRRVNPAHTSVCMLMAMVGLCMRALEACIAHLNLLTAFLHSCWCVRCRLSDVTSSRELSQRLLSLFYVFDQVLDEIAALMMLRH